MTDWSDEVAARLELWETFGEREQGWNEQIAADIRSALGEIKRLEGIEDAHVGCVAGNWNDRALRAEAKLAEAQAQLLRYELLKAAVNDSGECTDDEHGSACACNAAVMLENRQAEVERLRAALGHAQITLDKIGWELEKPTVDRSWLASVAHIERDLCRAALRGGGK